jgi:hypothetical protein
MPLQDHRLNPAHAVAERDGCQKGSADHALLLLR